MRKQDSEARRGGEGRQGFLGAGVERLLRFSVARPRLVVAVVALAAATAACFLPAIRLRLDGRSLIPRGNAEQVRSDRAAERFGAEDVVVIGVSSPESGIYRPETLELLAELSGGLAEVEGVRRDSVASLATLPRLFVEDDVLDPQPLLLRGEAVDGEKARRLERETRALGLDDGILVSKDGSTAAIYAEVDPGADRDALLSAVRALIDRPLAAGVSLHLSGTALAQATLGRSAARDLAYLVPGVILLLGLVLTLLFRHPAPAVVSLAEIGASLVLTTGLMGFLNESVFVTTLVLPVILIVIGVCDDVYALNRYFRSLRSGGDKARTIVESFHGVALPILLTSGTTVAGLLSLTLTRLEPQRVFGFYGALAIVFSTLMTFSLVPALLVLLPVPKPRRGRAWEAPFLELLWAGLVRFGTRRFLAALAAATILLIIAVRTIDVDDNWVRNLPASSDVARGDTALNERLAGTIRVEFLADSGAREGLLDATAFAALGRLEAALASLPEVGAVTGVYSDTVRLRAALDGVSYDEALRGIASQPLGTVEIHQSILLLSSLKRSPLSENLDETRRRARVTAFVPDADYRRIRRVVKTAESSCGELVLTPFGDGWTSYLAVRSLVSGQVQSVAWALITDALLILLLFRSLKLTFLTVAPIAFSVLGVFAFLALMGVPLGIANSMFAAIALGIGVDYSIHLVAHYREARVRGLQTDHAVREALLSAGPAILKGAVAVAAGLAILGFSEVSPNRELGWLVCLSLATCAGATLVIVPGLVLAWQRFVLPVKPGGLPSPSLEHSPEY